MALVFYFTCRYHQRSRKLRTENLLAWKVQPQLQSSFTPVSQLLLSPTHNALTFHLTLTVLKFVFFFLLERSSCLFPTKKNSQRIISTALIDQSTILSVSRTLLQYHPPAPPHSLKARIALSATYQAAHSTIIITSTSHLDRNIIFSVSSTLLQYRPPAPSHSLQATSNSTIHHDRAYNNGCDSHRGVLPCDRHSQMGTETLEAANCRRWQQIQPLEAQVLSRQVSHNRPTCAAEVRMLGGSSSQLITNTT
jgi:hypothetical protein